MPTAGQVWYCAADGCAASTSDPYKDRWVEPAVGGMLCPQHWASLGAPGAEGLLALSRENRSSIELKRNAKGEYAWDVKLYFDETDDAGRHAAIDRIEAIDARLASWFCGEVVRDPAEVAGA